MLPRALSGPVFFLLLGFAGPSGGCPHHPDPTDTDTETGTTDTDTDTGTTDTDTGTLPPDPGALIQVTTASVTSILLDEIPAGLERDVVRDALLAEGPEVWEDRVERQLDLSYVRLTFRPFFAFLFPLEYGSSTSGSGYGYPLKGQLPLPPSSVWNVTVSAPRVMTIGGHEHVGVDYTYESVIVTGVEEPGLSEPALASVGGVWEEEIYFPADTELLFQRIGYACASEIDYPANSVTESNVHLFFDDTCLEGSGTVAELDGCHQNPGSPFDCTEAIDLFIGAAPTMFRFERLPWDESVAFAYEVFAPATVPGADIQPQVEGALTNNTVTYRFFDETSCEIEEGTGFLGWNKVIEFDSTARNIGLNDLHVGDVEALVEDGTKLMEFSGCHGHYHFSHYADFGFGVSDGAKRAFCMMSTNRLSNNVTTDLVHYYYSCTFQGITAGWGDMYQEGLSGQWVNMTHLALEQDPTVDSLFTHNNPDGMLCEGIRRFGPAGEPLYVDTPFLNAAGEVIQTFDCDQSPNALDNNLAELEVELPGQHQGFTTQACAHSEVGPKRDCGLTFVETVECQPGDPVVYQAAAVAEATLQTIRICEASRLIGGIACTERQAIVNQVGTTAEFECPLMRDALPEGSNSVRGKYAVYVGDVL